MTTRILALGLLIALGCSDAGAVAWRQVDSETGLFGFRVPASWEVVSAGPILKYRSPKTGGELAVGPRIGTANPEEMADGLWREAFGNVPPQEPWKRPDGAEGQAWQRSAARNDRRIQMVVLAAVPFYVSATLEDSQQAFDDNAKVYEAILRSVTLGPNAIGPR